MVTEQENGGTFGGTRHVLFLDLGSGYLCVHFRGQPQFTDFLLSESHCSLESGEKPAGQELFLWFLIHRFHAYLFPFISPASEKLNLIMTHWGSLSERSRVALGWLRKSWTPCPRLLS